MSYYITILYIQFSIHTVPKEVGLHISHFIYKFFSSTVLAWEKLPVLEVIEHDDNKAHLIIWLDQKKKSLK